MRISAATGRTALVQRLCRARDRHELTRVTRTIDGADRIEGYVVGVGSKWVLLRDRVNMRLDAHVALRLRDLERVWRHSNGDVVMRAALELSGDWPPTRDAAPGIDLDSTRELIRSVATAAPLLNVQLEDRDPDIAFIGAAIAIEDTRVTLAEVSPSGAWEDATSSWRYGDITRVEFGGEYERVLARVAGPRPE